VCFIFVFFETLEFITKNNPTIEVNIYAVNAKVMKIYCVFFKKESKFPVSLYTKILLFKYFCLFSVEQVYFIFFYVFENYYKQMKNEIPLDLNLSGSSPIDSFNVNFDNPPIIRVNQEQRLEVLDGNGFLFFAHCWHVEGENSFLFNHHWRLITNLFFLNIFFVFVLGLRGVFIVDLIGNGVTCRALIRKGELRYICDQCTDSTKGYVFKVFNEYNELIDNPKIWMAGKKNLLWILFLMLGLITIPGKGVSDGWSPGRKRVK
jgi:hypothetical protein